MVGRARDAWHITVDSMTDYQMDELNALIAEVTDINSRLGRLYDAVEPGNIDLNDLAPRIRELRDRQESCGLERLKLTTFYQTGG